MQQGKVVCINGSFFVSPEAVIPVLDGGVLYGQGLFETILIKAGEPVLLERHLKRLADSSGELSIVLPFSAGELSMLLNETVKRNGISVSAARITLTAGEEGRNPNLIIHLRPLPYTREHYAKGFKAGFVSMRRNEKSLLVKHKTTCYFENMLARREARAKGLDEGLFLNTRGEIAEGTVSNIFLVKDGKVITPDLESGLLPGIMRGAVIKACQQKGLPLEERKVLPRELQDCQEAFITNSLVGVMPLVNVHNQTAGGGVTGEITAFLMKEVQEVFYYL